VRGRYYLFSTAAVIGVLASTITGRWWLLFLLLPLSWLFYRISNGLVTALLIVLSIFFMIYASSLNQVRSSQIPANSTDFMGKITSLPSIDGNRLSFQLTHSSGEKLQLYYTIQMEREQQKLTHLTYGMLCTFSGELREPGTSRNFYDFNYKKYLYQQNIHWIVSPQTLSLANCQNSSLNAIDYLQRFRGDNVRYVEKAYPPEISGVVNALLFGYRDGINEELLKSYQTLGLIHLLAVSGLHVGIIIGSLYIILIRLGLSKERAMDTLLGLIPLYILLAGAAPSIIRSGLMAIVVIISLRFKWRLHALDGISLSCLLMLLLNPFYLFSIGFQLSFTISFGLIVSVPVILKKVQTKIGQLFATSLISQCLSLPILLWNFYEVSLWSLPLNLIYIPFVSIFVLPMSIISFVSHHFFPPIGEVVIVVLQHSLEKAHYFLNWMYQLPGTLVFGKPSLLFIVALFAALFYLFISWENKGGCRRFCLPIIVIVGLLSYQWFSPYLSKSGEITFLDVGQGDCILIELPYRKAAILIDTGGTIHFNTGAWQQRRRSYEVGEDTVLPYLKAKGIRKLDMMILTHGDYDHIGGANSLLSSVEIDEILYGKGPVDGDFEKKLLMQALEEEIKVTPVFQGMKWTRGNSNFQILAPKGNETDRNDRSIVLYAKLFGMNWLFTGDLNASGEANLIREYPHIPTDVLKIAHHGSDSSSSESFLLHTDPKLAVISVGETNRYGHPSMNVLERLERRKIPILRTDKHGAVRVKYRNGNIITDWSVSSRRR
jgi:competence protein ComEC